MRAALGLPRWVAALLLVAMLALAAGGLVARSLQALVPGGRHERSTLGAHRRRPG
jgi:hypothetical protein